MHRFEVWAPTPARVELVLEDRRVAMARRDGGWWRTDVDGAGHGTRYGYSLDGGPVRPDPRSMHQPDGIDGRSAVVDHDAFHWTDDTWRGLPLPGAVLYELHVGTFSPEGTFEGAIARLPHLVDLFAPHHAYGGPDGLKRLVDACHGHGLGVVVDVVYNHLGPAGNHLAAFGPYFTDRHQTPWGDAVNFDGPGAGEVRRFVVDNALHWLDAYRCDGLRIDAVHAIADESQVHILEQLGTAVDALAAHVGKPLFVIAENDTNDPRLVRSRDAGGFGLAAAWADDWHHAVHVALTGESTGYYADFVDPAALPTAPDPNLRSSGEVLSSPQRRFGDAGVGGATLAKALCQAWVLDGTWSAYRGRSHGQPPDGLDPARFVVCTQNHDQVGNRACGERLAALVSEGRLHVAAALLLSTPFTPMLFQGEEWGASTPFQYFTDHRDPDLGRAVSEGRRSEFAAFGWPPDAVPDPQDPATFERSVLRWDELDEPAHRRILEWYRTLIRLRREHPSLTDPRLAVEVDVDGGLIRLRRGPIHLAANLGPAERTVTVDPEGEVLAASVPVDGARIADLVLPVDSVVVWQAVSG